MHIARDIKNNNFISHKMLKMYGVNPNVKQDIHNNWWLQPYFFYTIRSTNTKENRGYEYDYTKKYSKKLWNSSGIKRC